MSTDTEIMAAIDKAFGEFRRPKHFTNYKHCEECLEHDHTLRGKEREALTREDLGTIGWDPVTFCDLPAKAYLLPRLARELLAEPDQYWGWYGPQFISHVHRTSSDNDFLSFCNDEQRASIAFLLWHVINSRSALIAEYGDVEEYKIALVEWKGAQQCAPIDAEAAPRPQRD